MIQTGEATADHHQVIVGAPTAETYEPLETGSVIEVGPNFVTVMTGIAYGPVFVTIDVLTAAPPIEVGEPPWEAVEEATIKITKSIYVIDLAGAKSSDFDRVAVKRGLHRFRVAARGRDDRWDMDVTEPTEHYLVQIWPTTQPAEMTRLRKVDTAWDQDIVKHPARNWWDPDPAADATLYIKFGYEQMAEWAKENARRWGGRPPTEKLDRMPGAMKLSSVDRPLADAITRAKPAKLDSLARWAAHRTYTLAGLSEIDWIRPAVDALLSQEPLPYPFGKDSRGDLYERFLSDDSIDTAATGRGAPFRAIYALSEAIDENPMLAAFQSIHTAAHTDEENYTALVTELRKNFFPRLMPVEKYERWI